MEWLKSLRAQLWSPNKGGQGRSTHGAEAAKEVADRNGKQENIAAVKGDVSANINGHDLCNNEGHDLCINDHDLCTEISATGPNFQGINACMMERNIGVIDSGISTCMAFNSMGLSRADVSVAM